jgi:CRP-like cAMP-binding protein
MANEIEALLAPFYRRLEIRDTLSPREKQAILEAAGPLRRFRIGQDLVKQGEEPGVSRLLVQGLTARYSHVEDGGRQITGIHIAGDFVDLHSFPLKVMDHSITALTECAVIDFTHEHLRTITEREPHLGRMLWLCTMLDAALHRQWLVTKGRLTAEEHAAHFFCEMYERSRSVGLASDGGFWLPISQITLSDALGVSYVHVNRIVQRLRQEHLFEWQGAEVKILDWERLQRAGQFDATYLNLVKRPR